MPKKKKCTCSVENECGDYANCTKPKQKCNQCGKEFKICRMKTEKIQHLGKEYIRYTCEECDFLNRGEQAGREYMESLIGQEVDEGIIVTRSNIHDLFKGGYI